jgi:hypothetical protein
MYCPYKPLETNLNPTTEIKNIFNNAEIMSTIHDHLPNSVKYGLNLIPKGFLLVLGLLLYWFGCFALLFFKVCFKARLFLLKVVRDEATLAL